MADESPQENGQFVEMARTKGPDHPLIWTGLLTLLVVASFALMVWVVFHV